MTKRILTILVSIIVFALAFAALWIYGSTGSFPFLGSVFPSRLTDVQSPTEPPNLIGDWKQSNSASKEDAMIATISGDTIEVYWSSPDSQSLYWSGSFEAPTEPGNEYSWVSNNDHEKTDSGMIASSDDTKDFTYTNGELSFSASAAGTTMTVRMKKVD